MVRSLRLKHDERSDVIKAKKKKKNMLYRESANVGPKNGDAGAFPFLSAQSEILLPGVSRAGD